MKLPYCLWQFQWGGLLFPLYGQPIDIPSHLLHDVEKMPTQDAQLHSNMMYLILMMYNKWSRVLSLSLFFLLLMRMYMGQVTEVQLSCYLVLLSNDSKTRYQDSHTFVTWPIWTCQYMLANESWSDVESVWSQISTDVSLLVSWVATCVMKM